MEAIEKYREEIIRDILKVGSFKKAREIHWKEKIGEILGKNIKKENLSQLGESLRDIFFSTNEGSEREQNILSAAGTAWECLIAWYLNLGLIGTRTIVLRPQKKFNFSAISNAVTVKYEGFESNSESDLIAITFPKEREICYNISFLENFRETLFDYNDLNQVNNQEFKTVKETLNRIIEDNFLKLKVNIIQCKTNWNDNAQIPMAWDMIYFANGFKDREIYLGKNNFSVGKLNEFKYSFITVPTQKDAESYKITSVPVLRVNKLSGKNFWGLPTKNGIAYSVWEIFNLNYEESFNEVEFDERIKNIDSSYFDIF